jgi:diketogulonate reductase-like aldo/keto reductase
MAENFAIFDFQLTPQDMTAIASLDMKPDRVFRSPRPGNGEMDQHGDPQHVSLSDL